ncbi:MAG: hypothetical protein ACKV22_08965 [Bryobacteraceae bacterium]
MARGWESKSVEGQIEAAIGRNKARFTKTPLKGVEQATRERERSTLELSRKRVLNQLGDAHNTRYTEMLRKALTDLDKRIELLR